MARGALIVFEGADRIGKTSQTQRCVSALRMAGIPVAEGAPWQFPDRTTPIGNMLDAYLRSATDMDDRALHLLFSANRWEKERDICAALGRGETVVLDRYAFSGVAYSACKGLDMAWCKSPDSGLPEPDLVLYLSLPFEVAAERGEFGAERYENEKMQKAVADKFSLLMTDSWVAVDANATADAIFDNVMDAIHPALAKAKETSVIGKLWMD